MKHLTEDDLLAYQLGEPTGQKAAEIAAHLELCSRCAEEAGQIAETLRIYSADAVPAPNLDHAWQRLRGNLPVLEASRPRWFGAGWWRVALPVLAMLLMVGGLLLRMRPHAAPVAQLPPGPLSEQPRDAQIAAHLDEAERLLTVVSHEAGTPDASTRAQAEKLLIENAAYMREARTAGDLPEASVLEDLGRTLTLLHHAPRRDDGWHVRMELNASGLLLDIRILQQNGAQSPAAAPAR